MKGRARYLLAGVALVAIAFSVFSFVQRRSRLNEPFGKERFEHAADFAGREVANFIGAGKRVVLMGPETEAIEYYRIQVEGFERVLRSGGVEVVGREGLTQSDQGSRYMLWGKGTPGREIMEKAARHENVDFVVCVVYVPVFTRADLKEAESGGLPPLVVALAEGYQTGMYELMGSGLVQLGILSGLPGAATGQGRASSPEEKFRRRYTMVTPDNYRQFRMN
jgi:hypothetical protein